MLIIIISMVVTILAIVILVLKIKSDKLKLYNTKISEVEKKLDVQLEEKFSLLFEIQKKLSEQTTDSGFNILCNIEDVENDGFLLNAILNKAYREINAFLDERRNYVPDNTTNELLNKLHDVDIECTALKNYYNEKSIILNNLTKKFSYKIISKFLKISKKELYNDPIEEEFEILKKK